MINPTSVLQYQNSEMPVREIAQELGVDGVIQGSVFRAGDSVGIELRLVRRRGSGCALQARRRMTREGLTTAFEATARHITEPHVIDPSMLLEHLRRY